MVEDRASCGNYSPRFGSWFADTDLDEDGELAPRRHRDVAVAAPRASRGHPSLWLFGGGIDRRGLTLPFLLMETLQMLS